MAPVVSGFIAFRLPAFHANPRKRLVRMPKLYFHDTGLVCWLLGIRQSEQLRTHPLRGPVFETWVVSEALRHRTNRGRTGGLWFYRDRNGAEVDLVVDEPAGLTLIEAKSSTTASSSLFDGARRVRRHFADSSPPCTVAVAYGGDQFQLRSVGRLVPWRMLRAATLPGSDHVVSVFASGRPVSGAGVLGLFPNGTWKHAVTGENGEAALNLHSVHLPMTVFVAAEGYSAPGARLGPRRTHAPCRVGCAAERRCSDLPGGDGRNSRLVGETESDTGYARQNLHVRVQYRH